MNNKRARWLELFRSSGKSNPVFVLALVLLFGMISACSPTVATATPTEVEVQPNSEPRPLPTEIEEDIELQPTLAPTAVETTEALPTSVPVPAVNAGDWIKGASDAAVSVIVYEDFQ
jgi:hypothetical protein